MKILLACCVVDYNQRDGRGNAFVPSLIKLIQGWDGPPGSLEFLEVFRTSLQMAQEGCVRRAIDIDATHILFVEDDTTRIPDGILRKFVDYDKDVVAAFSYARHYPYFPTIFRKGNKDISWNDIIGPQTILVTPYTGLRRVDMVPFQFTLIKMDVFEKIPEPWFEFTRKIMGYNATDQHFCQSCLENEVELWCDTDSVVQHAGIDGATAAFNVWMQRNPGSLGIMHPAQIVPLLRECGVNVSAEDLPCVYPEVF